MQALLEAAVSQLVQGAPVLIPLLERFSQGQIDQWRSEKGWAILCEVYAKMLGCVIRDWVIITATWICPLRASHIWQW